MCNATKKNGSPCGFHIAKGETVCINHKNPETVRRAAVRASRAAAIARQRNSASLIDAAFSLHDRASIQATIEGLLRLHLSGALSAETTRQAVSICRLALVNFDRPKETIGGWQAQSHEPSGHYSRTLGFLSSIDPLLVEAAERDEEAASAAAEGEEQWMN